MIDGVVINEWLTVPEHEIEISTSRGSGPGGQHVNKTDTRVTIRWNVKNSSVLSQEQKDRIVQNLHARLTNDGDLILHSGASRSQQQNKENAFIILAQVIKKALYVPKKRMATRVSKAVKASRMEHKKHRSFVKKTRSKRYGFE
jgi:ribosome-associated protein